MIEVLILKLWFKWIASYWNEWGNLVQGASRRSNNDAIIECSEQLSTEIVVVALRLLIASY